MLFRQKMYEEFFGIKKRKIKILPLFKNFEILQYLTKKISFKNFRKVRSMKTPTHDFVVNAQLS